jgi:flagellin
MSITQINQNISSLTAQRNLSINGNRISASIQKLSSGLRINSGADDPSGLVLSELMRAQVSGLDQAQSNAQQGVNVVKTAEGALNEVNGLLRQMRNLAVSAASDSNNTDQSRAALQAQVSSALKTIDGIATRTVYGKRNLLDGSAGTKTTVLDSTVVSSSNLNLAPAAQSAGNAGNVSVNVTIAAAKAKVDSAAMAGAVATDLFSAATNNVGFDAGDEAALYVNGTKINIAVNGQNTNISATTTYQNIIDSINANSTSLGVTATWDTSGANPVMSITSNAYGSDQHVSVEYVKVTDQGGDMVLADALSGAGEDLSKTAAGVNAAATVTFQGAAGAQSFATGKGLALVSGNGFGTILLTEGGNTVANKGNVLSASKGSLSFQVGIDANQIAEVNIADCHAASLGTGTTGAANLGAIDISTVTGANLALATLDKAIQDVSALRGNLGAFQTNELAAQSRSLAVSRENLAASENQIRDTDFAKEMSEFTSSQVLVQSATAFLAQANSLTQNVMQLIKG